MDDSNCISLISELCKSCLLTSGSEEISPCFLKRLIRKVLSTIFMFRQGPPKEDSLADDPYQLIRIEIFSHVLADGFKNPDGRTQINQCLADLEDMYNESSEENLLSVLSFLFTLSKINAKKNSISPGCGENNDNGVYLDSNNFNDINWSIFHEDSIAYQTNFEYPFHESPGTGLKFFASDFPSVNSLCNEFANIYDGKCKLWSFDLNRAVEPVIQDEGFVTPGSDFSKEPSLHSDSCDSDGSVPSVDDFNYDLQSLGLGKCTWEQLGHCAPPSEPFFASESRESLVHIWKIWNAFRQPMIKSLPIGERITFENLKTDINYLLLGVPSNSFYFNQLTETFHLRDSLHLETLTPELLIQFCESVRECGFSYQSLKNFAEYRSKMPFGPISQMFCQCLRQVLHIHRYCVLHINWDNICCLSQLEMIVLPLKRKLSFLAKLCFITEGEKSSGAKFPSGVQLLDYLYSNLSKMARPDFRYILFHLFEGCCNTYLKIVAEWIFNGSFSNPDNYGEFFIEIQREHEICRDWRRVSCIRMKEKHVPKFLEKVYKDIFVCGKSVNLLKIFSPRDTLEKILPQSYPSVHCCFNKTQFDGYAESWKRFQDDFSKTFNSNVKLKDKLEKKYSAEFYEKIKAVRREWFRQYERNLGQANDVSSTIGDVTKTDKLFANELIKSESLNNKRKSETDVHLFSFNENALCLTENTEPLPNSRIASSENEDSPENSIQDPSQILEVEANLEDERSNVSYSSTSLSNKLDDGNELEKHSGSCYKVNESGDGPTVDTPCTAALDKSACDLVAVDPKFRTRLTVTLPTSIYGGGGGDIISSGKNILTLEEYEVNKRKSVSSDYQNWLNMTGDQQVYNKRTALSIPSVTPIYEQSKLQSVTSNHQNQLNTSTDQQVFDKKVIICTPLSACAQNRIKVMSSVIREGSSLANDCDEEEVTHSTPMTVCVQNRLRAMSSVIQEGSSPCNDAEVEKIVQSTPMTACMRNKLRVMSSEYHQRLCISNDETTTSSVLKSRELNECEKNKLKVMSSEYHIRLGALADQNELIEEKLMQKAGQTKFSDCESNKSKAMASDYQDSLKILSVGRTKTTEPEPNILLESKNENECVSVDLEPESVSEDVETDDQITVIENLADDPKIYERTPANNKKIQSQNCESVFDLNNYISHSTVLWNPAVEDLDQLKSTADSVKNVDTASVLYYLSSSILMPLKIQSKLVNEAILRVFIVQESYLDHLITLKNYLLLKRPEFSLLLTSTIFEMSEKVKKPFMLLNSYTLSSILQQALLASNSRKSIQFERKLAFVVEDSVPETFVFTDIRMLNCLSLTYSVKWPINVLITEPIMKKYSRVFKFLMQLQRASWTLKSDFKNLKNLKRGKSIQYVQIQLYRHSMTQVIRVLLEFIMREALEKCWNDLVSYLTSTEINLDELYMSHLKYINKIMQRCFLCDLSISCHEAILNLLSSILKYHEALRAGSWQLNVQVNFLYHTNFKNIHSVFEEFQKHLDDVRTQLKVLVYRRQRRYLEPLFVELCNNNRNETAL